MTIASIITKLPLLKLFRQSNMVSELCEDIEIYYLMFNHMNDDKLQHINTHQPNEIKLFFEGWELYQRVVENNYMKHQEMIELFGSLD